MTTSFLFVLLAVVFIVALIVVYALSRCKNVKALCKLPFAVFWFEAEQSGSANASVEKNQSS